MVDFGFWILDVSGLFSRAIMQSGDCDGPWLIFDGANAKRFGNECVHSFYYYFFFLVRYQRVQGLCMCLGPVSWMHHL